MRLLAKLLVATPLLLLAVPAQAQLSSLSNPSSASLTSLTQLPSVNNTTLLGNVSGGVSTPQALTSTQATTVLDVFTSSLKGLVPSSGGGTTNYLRADGSWAAPPGSGGGSGTVTTVSVTTANGVSGTVANPTTTPAISVSLGAITPSSVAASGTVTGSNLSGTSSGTNTGDQTITLSGDVAGTGTGAITTTISALPLSKLATQAATTLVGNATGSSAVPTAIGLGPSFTFSGSTMYGASDHPGYVTNNWYSTVRSGTVATSASFAGGNIKLTPFTISKPITVAALAARVNTLAASGNFQLAIYGNAALTGRPTGTALCTTGSISTAATGVISGTASCTGVLTPGTYWGGINLDASASSTALFQTIAASEPEGTYLIGSATIANVAPASASSGFDLSVTQTFGTWPDLTSASFTEQAGTTSALVFMKAQ